MTESKKNSIAWGREVVRIEARAVAALEQRHAFLTNARGARAGRCGKSAKGRRVGTALWLLRLQET